MALEGGIREPRLNELDIVVAEMTSNLFKFGDQGEILAGVFANGGNPYIELISIDSGPGMTNPAKMLHDGVSTVNTMGHGLGSIKRLSGDFDLYSLPGWGTIVLSRIYNEPERKAGREPVVVRALVVSKPGETTCGDGLIIKKTTSYLKLTLADGLGHGPEANKAVNEAAAAIRVFPDQSPTDTIRFIHPAIKKTRGAVMNVLLYDFASKTWRSTGVGNIAVRMFGPNQVKNHMSYNGIVGHNIPNSMNEQVYSAEQYNLVVLCSDGIKTRWDIIKYPNIRKFDPAILNAAIYKDHARRTDDMSVVSIKIK